MSRHKTNEALADHLASRLPVFPTDAQIKAELGISDHDYYREVAKAAGVTKSKATRKTWRYTVLDAKKMLGVILSGEVN